MPKWTPYISGERAVVVGGDYIYCYALTHEESVKFAAAHNADIDALTAEIQQFRDAYAHDREIMAEQAAQLESYEARMEEYEAELAQVKAESLRVVKIGEMCGAHDAEGRENFVMIGDEVLMPEPYLWDWIRLDGTHPDITDDTIVQPVRLERWEDE